MRALLVGIGAVRLAFPNEEQVLGWGWQASVSVFSISVLLID